jgi:hypothetical protein
MRTLPSKQEFLICVDENSLCTRIVSQDSALFLFVSNSVISSWVKERNDAEKFGSKFINAESIGTNNSNFEDYKIKVSTKGHGCRIYEQIMISKIINASTQFDRYCTIFKAQGRASCMQPNWIYFPVQGLRVD